MPTVEFPQFQWVAAPRDARSLWLTGRILSTAGPRGPRPRVAVLQREELLVRLPPPHRFVHEGAGGLLQDARQAVLAQSEVRGQGSLSVGLVDHDELIVPDPDAGQGTGRPSVRGWPHRSHAVNLTTGGE